MTIEKITYTDPASEDIGSDGKLIGTDYRNVSDEYKRVPMKMIRESLDEKRMPLVNVLFNITGDFNKSSVVRTTNAFLGDRVYIIGKRRFDRRGAAGTHHYEHINHSTEFDEVLAELESDGYTVFAVDNTAEFAPVNIWDAEIPLKSAFVYGEEGNGLDDDTVSKCHQSIYIHQRGSVRSINVAVASGIVMAEYSRRHLHSAG